MQKILALFVVLMGVLLVSVALSGGGGAGRIDALNSPACTDVDGDGAVTLKDAFIVQTYFGQTMAPAQVDIDGNSTVDLFNDIFGVFFTFGATTSCQTKGPVGALTPQPTETVVPQPQMSLNVTGPSVICDAPTQPTKCNVPLATTASLVVVMDAAPPTGYLGIQTQIVYGPLSYSPTASASSEIVWPASAVPVRWPLAPTGAEGLVVHASDSSSTPPFTNTSYEGDLVELAVTCTSAESFRVFLPVKTSTNQKGTFIIADQAANVIPQTAGTQLVAQIDPVYPVPVADYLDVNCGPPVTPTSTNTPPVAAVTAAPGVTPGSVGGLSFAPPGGSSSGGGAGYGVAAAVVAAVASLGGAAWYVRRRQLR